MPLGITRINLFLVVLTFGIVLWVNQVGLFPMGYFKLVKELSSAGQATGHHNNQINEQQHQPTQPTDHSHNNPTQQQHQQQPPTTTVHLPTEEVGVPKVKGGILITGGMGHIGTALIKRFIYENETVFSLDVLAPHQVPFFRTAGLEHNFEAIVGDVRNHSLLEWIFHTHTIRGVIHLAAITKEASCASAPKYCHSVNVGGTDALMKVISLLPKSIYPSPPWVVHASSLQPRFRHTGFETSAIMKDRVLQTKLDSELVLWRYKGEVTSANHRVHPVRSTILRLGHVYGAYDGEYRLKLIPRLLRNAVNQLPLFHYLDNRDDWRNHFEFLHMDDAVSAFILAGKALDSNGLFKESRRDATTPTTPEDGEEAPIPVDLPNVAQEPEPEKENEDDEGVGSDDEENLGQFDITGGEVVSIKEVVSLMINLTRSTSSAVFIPGPDNLPSVASAVNMDPTTLIPTDINKARKYLGFTPKVKFEEGLGWYAEEVEHRTLHYLDEKSKIYCLTTHNGETNHEVETHPIFQHERRRYHYIQQRAEHLRQSTVCTNLFRDFQLDGIRAAHVDRAICRNNNGSRPVGKISWCDELMSAEQFVVTGWGRDEWLDEACGNTTHMRDLSTCEYDCEHPTVCMRTGRCKCVDMDRCNEDPYPNPPLHIAVKEQEEIHGGWEPSAMVHLLMNWLGRHLPRTYPKINILPLNSSIGENLEACRGVEAKLNNSCFGVTQRILDAISTVQVPLHDADTAVVPFYHSCSMSVYRYYTMAYTLMFPPHNTNNTIQHQQQQQHLNSKFKSMLWIMAHDWSKCEVFRWSTADLRRGSLDRPALPLFTPYTRPPSFVLQTNGDTNTNCFNPSVDVVIPPEGCNTPDLLEISVQSLRAMEEREVDVLHLSTPMGTGGLLRLLINCPALYQTDNMMMPLIDDHTPNTPNDNPHTNPLLQWQQRPLATVLGRKKHNRAEYISLLGNSRFCLSPRGVAGWSPRTFDAIAMGCIPVLISDYTVYPFQQVLDWTKFSVFIRESELPILQDILRGISLERMEEMQLALKIIRHSFLYDPSKSLLAANTPIDLTLRLLSLQMLRREYRI